jgi:hypothetical protein
VTRGDTLYLFSKVDMETEIIRSYSIIFFLIAAILISTPYEQKEENDI